jgi:hypothetical protein
MDKDNTDAKSITIMVKPFYLEKQQQHTELILKALEPIDIIYFLYTI